MLTSFERWLHENQDSAPAISQAAFKKRFAKAFGKKPSAKVMAMFKDDAQYDYIVGRLLDREKKLRQQPMATPDVSGSRGRFADLPPLMDREARNALGRAIAKPVQVMVKLWQKDPEWRFALDSADLPVDSRMFRAFSREKRPLYRAVWKSAIGELRRKNPRMIANFEHVAPDFSEFMAIGDEAVRNFLDRLNLRRGKDMTSGDPRIIRDVLSWVSKKNMLHPEHLASLLFTVFTPKPVRKLMPLPQSAQVLGDTLKVVPSRDAFDMLPDFWAYTSGPILKRLAMLEKKIQRAKDALPRREDDLERLETAIEEAETEGRPVKNEVREEAASLRRQILQLRRFIGQQSKVGRIQVTDRKTGVLDLIKILRTINAALESIGKKLQIVGPRVREDRPEVPLSRSLTTKGRFARTLQGRSREEVLDAISDVSVSGHPQQALHRKLGMMFRPEAHDAVEDGARLKALLGGIAKATANKDPNRVEELKKQIVPIAKGFFEAAVRLAKKELDDANKEDDPGVAWRTTMKAVRRLQDVYSLASLMSQTDSLPESATKAASKRADSLRTTLEKLKTPSKESVEKAIAIADEIARQRYKNPKTIEKHAEIRREGLKQQWRDLWRDF